MGELDLKVEAVMVKLSSEVNVEKGAYEVVVEQEAGAMVVGESAIIAMGEVMVITAE